MRPLSPHLGIYRFTPTMAASIAHRVAGIVLYAAMPLFSAWLSAQAYGDASLKSILRDVLSSPLGLVVLAALSWTVIHHALGGIRHLAWDLGFGFETAKGSALAVLLGAPLLAAIFWIAALSV